MSNTEKINFSGHSGRKFWERRCQNISHHHKQNRFCQNINVFGGGSRTYRKGWFWEHCQSEPTSTSGTIKFSPFLPLVLYGSGSRTTSVQGGFKLPFWKLCNKNLPLKAQTVTMLHHYVLMKWRSKRSTNMTHDLTNFLVHTRGFSWQF